MDLHLILKNIQEILNSYTELERKELTTSIDYTRDLDMDSFTVLQFLEQVEEDFSVSLSPAEILSEENHTLIGLAGLVKQKIK